MTRLLLRALIATLLAATVIWLVQWRLAEAGEVAAARRPLDFASPPASPPAWPISLPSGEAWLIYLLPPTAALPEQVRPVVALGLDGEFRLVRAALPPVGPLETDWLAAAVVLPHARLADLSPRARAALLDVLHRWRGSLTLGLSQRVIPSRGLDATGLTALLRFAR